MSLSKLQEMAGTSINSGDVQAMHGHGLTVSTMQAALAAGLDFNTVLNLFKQFGPTFITILSVVLPLLKTPTPAPTPTPEPPAPTP